METILREVFGESSDEENDDDGSRSVDCSIFEGPIGLSTTWTPIDEVPGLWMCRDFIFADEQALLLSKIEKEGWFAKASQNQAMRFGDLPQWVLELANYIHDALFFNEHDSNKLDAMYFNGQNQVQSLPLDVLQREPLFDQLIVNVYQPGEGICSHVDLMRFEDGIAIVSLESPCVMHFTPVEEKVSVETCLSKTKIPVYLTPGSLVLLSGVARYHWNHEINRAPGYQIWDGKEIIQKRRTSITLRKLCPS